MRNYAQWKFRGKDSKGLTKEEKDEIGYYEKSSDTLRLCFVRGSFKDQGAITMEFTGGKNSKNHKGGDFKLPPNMLAEFFREIGVSFHFYTDRKHSYVAEIKYKPWTEWEQAFRKPKKINKKQAVDRSVKDGIMDI